MNLGKKDKQPADVKDYPVDYTDWLAEIVGGDVLESCIATVECITDPQDAALVVDQVVVSPKSLAVWLSGGTSGQSYKVTMVTTTAGGRVDESELTIRVKDR